MNNVFLRGNVTDKPEVRYLQSGTAVGSFSLAVNRKYKQGDDLKEEVSFFPVEVWGKTAELCAEYLEKGRQVLISDARLKQDRWENSEGQNRSKVVVVANRVDFLGGKPAQESDTKKEESSDKQEVPF